jgi:tetratricopeptide (TPR) repeat protein
VTSLATHHTPTLRPQGRGALLRFVAGLLMVVLAACSSAEVEKQARTEKADLHYKLANGYYHEHNIELAIGQLVEALELDDMHADARYLYGVILFGRKRYEEAVDHLRKAMISKPNFFAARNQLAVCYIEMDRYADAIATLEPLLKEPTYTTPYLAYNNLGLAYLKLGDLRQAEKHLRMAVFLNPKLCNGWRNLGLLAMQQRDYKNAVDHMTEATSRCPQYAELHLQRGEALEADGQQPEAETAFKKCTELAGDTQLGRRCKAHLRNQNVNQRGDSRHGWDHASLDP